MAYFGKRETSHFILDKPIKQYYKACDLMEKYDIKNNCRKGEIMRKKCSSCKKIRNGSKFRYRNKLRNKTQLKSICLLCERIKDKNREHTLRRRFSNYKKRAKRDGLEFKINKEKFKTITNMACTYCGGFSTSNSATFCGIDRTNSNKGYIKSNIVPCCNVCNMMKGSLACDEFTKHIEKMFGHIVGQ